MLEILPHKDIFVELAKEHDRIPVLGRAPIPGFELSELFHKLYLNEFASFLFESGKGPEEINQYSITGTTNSTLAWSDGNKATLLKPGQPARISEDPLDFLRQIPINEQPDRFEYAPPFWGGWVGYLGYEFSRRLERLPNRDYENESMPEYYFMQVDTAWLYEHSSGTLNFIVAQKPGEIPANAYDQASEMIQKTWKPILSGERFKTSKASSKTTLSKGKKHVVNSNMSTNIYEEMVSRAKKYIVEGDIYQANLVQKFTAEMKDCPFELYEKLKSINPAPFSGFLKTPFGTIVSSSPERLIKIEQGLAETRPIAGTRPRGGDTIEDDRLSAELLLNEKEKAEHLMLVDLERNDLGRICRTGSVQVDSLMFLEKYSHVIHIVSNIRGKIKSGLNLLDILKSVFPGGTITGCPKIRCMEIIQELEPDSRGPYSGSMGYIGFGSAMDLNILIRSIVVQNRKASFHVGAGIVADSDPAKEYQETLDKAAAMIEAITGENP